MRINGERFQAGITLIEPNPTVALAVMMPQGGARRDSYEEPAITVAGSSRRQVRLVLAKGGRWQVARALATGKACDEIASVSDHELCAALTCLALAIISLELPVMEAAQSRSAIAMEYICCLPISIEVGSAGSTRSTGGG